MILDHSLSKKRKSEIKYHLNGLETDVALCRNNYHKVCNDKRAILTALMNDSSEGIDDIGKVEFEAYLNALRRIKNRMVRKEKRFENDREEKYYDRRLGKIISRELSQVNYLVDQYNIIKDIFPFFDDSVPLFNMMVRESRRKKTIMDLVKKA